MSLTHGGNETFDSPSIHHRAVRRETSPMPSQWRCYFFAHRWHAVAQYRRRCFQLDFWTERRSFKVSTWALNSSTSSSMRVRLACSARLSLDCRSSMAIPQAVNRKFKRLILASSNSRRCVKSSFSFRSRAISGFSSSFSSSRMGSSAVVRWWWALVGARSQEDRWES